MNDFFIIDGSSYIYRAYYGIPSLNTSKGYPTNAIYGFLKMLKNTINIYKPKYIVIALDSKDASFRKKLYSEYKANRKETPDDLIVQIPHIYRLINTMNIKAISKETYEADDIIASLVKTYKDKFKITIISGDKDLLQLVDNNTCMLDTMKNIKYCPQDIVNKYSINPEQIKDYLAITGDSSDNIPGIKGLGPKAAVNLLKEYSNLNNIYLNLDKIKNPKYKNALVSNSDLALLSLKLVSLKEDLKFDLKEYEFSIKEINNEEFISFLKEFEFYSELNTLYKNQDLGIPVTKAQTNLNYKILDAYTICYKNLNIGYDFISRFNSEWLYNNDFFDIKLASYLLDPGKREYPIDSISLKYCNTPFIKDNLILIKEKLDLDLKKLNLNKVYYEIDKPCIPILKSMSELGVKVDLEELNKLKNIFTKDIYALKEKIFKYTDTDFNINSPKQLSYILFEKLNLTPIQKTKNFYSTGQDVLEELSLVHKLPKLIIEYRELSKLLNTYIEPFIKEANKDHKLHTTYTLDITATGRLSSLNPNLQNIPIKSINGAKIRKVFISDTNKILISADYSQIELRILSYLAKDKIMQDAFINDEDIHTRTASEIFDIDINLVSQDQRRHAKIVNFSILYGKTPYGLAKELGVSLNIAKHIIERYFKTYKGITEYRDLLIKEAKEKAYTKTYYERIRYLPDINSKNKALKAFAERNAVNTPIQGTASDILKIAMINLNNKLKLLSKKAKIIMHIHDELVLEAPIDEKYDIINLVKETMENVVDFKPKLKVDIKTGYNLLEMQSEL